MTKTVLVPTDGSQQANKAVQLACDLARAWEARLRILHVLLHNKAPRDLARLAELDGLSENLRRALAKAESLPPDASVPEWMYLLNPEAAPDRVPEAILRELGQEVLAHAKKQAEAEGITDIRLDLADGDAAELILEIAQRDGIDGIVMGRRGLRVIDELTEGSVSNKVSRLATCSVVTIT